MNPFTVVFGFFMLVMVIVIVVLLVKWGASKIGWQPDPQLLTIIYLMITLFFIMIFVNWAGIYVWWPRH